MIDEKRGLPHFGSFLVENVQLFLIETLLVGICKEIILRTQGNRLGEHEKSSLFGVHTSFQYILREEDRDFHVG